MALARYHGLLHSPSSTSYSNLKNLPLSWLSWLSNSIRLVVFFEEAKENTAAKTLDV